MKHVKPDAALSANTGPFRLLHIVPEDGIGGVEIAARRSGERLAGQIQVLFLKCRSGGELQRESVPGVTYGNSDRALSPGNAILAVRTARAIRPEVIVFSLWKTVLAFLFVRLFVRGPKLVLFLHSDRSTHVLDSLATMLMLRLCDAVWADSRSAIEGRLGDTCRRPTRVISFLLYRPGTAHVRQAKPRFAYWGRLNRTKGIDEAINLFHQIAEHHTDARFSIIGPDSGMLGQLQQQVRTMGLAGRVDFPGAMTMAQIEEATADASFFLQLSRQEGMAMSVVEAMQLGLVPVVTKVGEIANYCRDAENAVVHTTTDDTVRQIETLLGDEDKYLRMSSAAAEHWADAPLYQEDILQAAHAMSSEDSPACSRVAV